jgi:hypothetical protein
MSELPISAWEVQWIFNAVWPAIKEKFFYGFYAAIKANNDHIEVALEKFERDVNEITNGVIQDIFTNGKRLPQWSEQFLKSIATVDGFEHQRKTVMNTPIVWRLLELHVVQDKEFQRILTRAEHAMESFVKLYRKESIKYAESQKPNTRLLNKEREKLIKMTGLCVRDIQKFLHGKVFTLLQWLIAQSVRDPSAQYIDIESLGAQFTALEEKAYYARVAICLDRFLKEMIDLITIE